jgi:mercuric ion transport protein
MKPSTEKNSCACHKEAAKKHSGATAKGLKIAGIVPSVATSVFIAFFPKCPVCWGVYMSMFSGIGLARLPYMKWLLPVLLVLLGLHLYLLYVQRKRNGYAPFFVSLAGSLLIITGRLIFGSMTWLLYTGIVLVFLGSVLNGIVDVRYKLSQNKLSIN